jgi:hypothetical protein
MDFVAFVDTEGTGWPPPERALGIRVVIEVGEDTLLEDAVERAVLAATSTPKVEPRYHWIHFLRDHNEPSPEYLAMPRAVVAEDGQILWTEGAKDRVTIGDLFRARDAGFFDGDPQGVWLEIPMYGDGILRTWLEFLTWVEAIGGLAQLAVFLRAQYKKWESRGSRTPYAFLDLVTARDEWEGRDVQQFLNLNEQEARELLQLFGFENTEGDHWRMSRDPKRLYFRRQLYQDWLYREADDDADGGDEER